MSKRRKRLITILAVFVVLYFLLIGASYFFLRIFVFPTFEEYRMSGAYPYSIAEIPDDFAEYSVEGLKLSAPDCLDVKTDNPVIVSYLSNDASKYDLQITAFTGEDGLSDDFEWLKENPHLFNKWVTGCGWLTKLGMKKIGYEIPQSNNEMMYLLEKIDTKDYNKFSLTESYAFTKLALLKAIFIPAFIGYEKYDTEHPLETPLEVEESAYYFEEDSCRAIIRQGSSEGGRYRLVMTYYPESDQDHVRKLLVLSDDPVLAQTVAATVRPA